MRKRAIAYIDGYNLYYGLLKGAATYYRNIPRDLPARCQLPDEIPYGKRGDRFIHRPPAWA